MRRPVSNERLGRQMAFREMGEVDAEIRAAMARTAKDLGIYDKEAAAIDAHIAEVETFVVGKPGPKPGRLATAPNGSAVRSSKRDDHLDEPSTPGNKKPTVPRKFSFAKKPLADLLSYGRQIVAGQWEAGHAADLIGLYAVLHEHVFQVLPLELEQEFLAAQSSADKLVRDEFADDPVAAQAFVRWCWARLAKQRKKNPDSDFRPGWRIQFKSRSWLTDYKASGRA